MRALREQVRDESPAEAVTEVRARLCTGTRSMMQCDTTTGDWQSANVIVTPTCSLCRLERCGRSFVDGRNGAVALFFYWPVRGRDRELHRGKCKSVSTPAIHDIRSNNKWMNNSSYIKGHIIHKAHRTTAPFPALERVPPGISIGAVACSPGRRHCIPPGDHLFQRRTMPRS